MYIYIQYMIIKYQIVHHYPCFNLFILHNSFDNQESEINKNNIFYVPIYMYICNMYVYVYIYIYLRIY